MIQEESEHEEIVEPLP